MAIESQGTVVAISNETTGTAYASATFAEIGEVKTFDGPNGSASVIDASHLGSTRKEKLMGLPDEGQISFTFNRVFGDAGQEQARTARASRDAYWIKITYSDGQVAYGAGFVLEFSTSGGVDALTEGSMTVELSDEWTEV